MGRPPVPGGPPLEEIPVPAPRRALVVVDVQQEYFDGPLEIQHPPRAESLANVVSAVRAADAAGLPVVVVRHHLPAGAPIFAEGSPGHALHPDVEAVVDPSWKQVLKQNGSVFAGRTSRSGCAGRTSTPSPSSGT